MSLFSTLKQFETRPLSVPGAEMIISPVYSDIRGSLYESFHILKVRYSASIDSICGVYPAQGKFYGPVAHNGEELIYAIRGKVQIQLIDFNDHSVRTITEAFPGQVIRIPSMCIHTFYGLEEGTIFDIVRTEAITNQVDFDIHDPSLGIVIPEGAVQAGHGHPEPIRPDYAIMGSNGMIGSAFVREIEARGQTWVQIRSRLNQHESIENELRHIMPKISVIIAAGVGTRPNTKWCDDHRMETIDANVTSQLAIIRICQRLKLHCTIIGTSAFYHYDAEHPMGGKGFVEEDPSNHDANFYYEMRTLQEKLISDCGLENNVLNLRAIFPLDHNLTTSSLIGKLLRFSLIKSIPSSITVLNDLVPLALEMMKDGDVGKVNWVCEGTMSNGDVLRTYQKIVDPNFTFNEQIVKVEESFAAGNAAAYIIPQRLYQKFGDRVPKVQESMDKVMRLIKENKK